MAKLEKRGSLKSCYRKVCGFKSRWGYGTVMGVCRDEALGDPGGVSLEPSRNGGDVRPR